MRVRSFEFNLRELAGSMGDLGTLLPLAIGYLTVCKMSACGLLVTMGLAYIAMGLIYRLPMPIEPMKVLAVVAIAQAWTPEKIYTAAFVMGAAWLVMGTTGAMTFVARWTPNTVVLGIQLALGILLAAQGITLVYPGWVLGSVSVIIVLLLRRNRHIPAAVALVTLGIIIMGFRNELGSIRGVTVSLPPFTCFKTAEIWSVLRDGGLAQIPLTATNAVIATSALISRYWPGRRVTERQLSFNMGVMNAILPFFGGMPLCHGAGGLAGHYYFGARTGGANVIGGSIAVVVGLFFAGSIATLLTAFPTAIVGAMLFLVGAELLKLARDLRLSHESLVVVVTVLGATFVNMGIGFLVGLGFHYLLSGVSGRRPDVRATEATPLSDQAMKG